MSDNNELSLLDEDLDDDIDYDIGHEDEEALLADDYDDEVQTGEQNRDGFPEFEEPVEDDVLDLGVTDGLDDLDSEIQDNTEDLSLTVKKQAVVQEKPFSQPSVPAVIKEQPVEKIPEPQIVPAQTASYEADTSATASLPQVESEEEDEGGDEEGEGRNRFKSERPNIVSLKSGKTFGNIPDSLDNVIPIDEAAQKLGNRRDGNMWKNRKARGGNQRGAIRPHLQQAGGYGRGFIRHPLHMQSPQQQQPPPQQPPQMPPQQPPPHKILINPHFRGAVQPHPEARLIWDTDPGAQGDGLLPFPPPRTFPDNSYVSTPQVNYDQSYQHHEPVHGGYGIMPMQPQTQPQPYYQEPYSEQQVPPPQQTQPPPVMPAPDYWQDTQLPHCVGPHNNDGFYQQHGGGDGMFNMPHYEDQSFSMPVQGPQQPESWPAATTDNVQLSSTTQVATHQFAGTQGMFRMPAPGPPMPGMRFRPPGPGPYRHFNQQRPRFPGQMNGPHRGRRVGGLQIIRHQTPVQQQQQQQQQKGIRLQQKRPSFDGPNSNVVPLQQVRYDAGPKRKKRMPDMSNLHEVQTVDTLPPQPDEPDENEDEETREYRKKIEEQKRLRERILQQKEARRKLAALEKQRELQKKDIDLQGAGDAPQYVAPPGEPPQGNAIATIVNRNPVEPQPVVPAVRPNLHPVHVPPTAPQPQQQQQQQQNVVVLAGAQTQGVKMRGRGGRGGRFVRGRGRGGVGRGNVPQQFQPQQQQQQQQQQVIVQQQPVQKVQQAVPVVSIQKVQPKTEAIQKAIKPKVVNPVAPVPNQRIVRAAAPNMPKRVVLSQPARVVQANPARTVMLRGTNSTVPQQQPRRVVQQPAANPSGRTVVSNQSAGITVIAQPPEVPVPRTKLVRIENLAASTTESQLRQLCQKVGPVESIKMIPAQRTAMVTFVSPTSAATFMKRYQRKMVDLSLINVTLLVQ